MKVRNYYLGLVLLLSTLVSVFAQEKTISGVVTDQSGLPLPGATVLIKGTTTGTSTDFDGNYSIVSNQGETLVVSFVGYTTQEVVVGASNTLNIQLEESTQALDEVIVTAQGIRREKKALGYAVTEVKSEQLEQRSEGDVARILNGKSAGVQIIQQNGLSGSGTNIIIRGQNSFSASNQALFIVDGVPFSTDTNSNGRQGERNDFVNSNSGSSRFLDLDPNSIESVSVLKGLAAATLYGSQGRNGVILITTKAGSAKGSGASKTEISVASSYFVSEIASLPDYQNEYGNGFDQAFGWFFSNWGPAFRQDGVDGWGAQNAINGTNSGTPGYLLHPYSTSTPAIQAAFPEFQGALYEWKPYNSVKKFFNKGDASNISLNIRGTSNDGNLSYNVNYGHLDDKGFTPGNKLTRNTLGIGGNAKLSNKFVVSGVLNFSLTDFVSPPVALSQGDGATGTGSSIFGDLWFTPRSIDIQGLPYQDPITGGSVYYRQDNTIQHPLWTLHNASSQQDTNRVFGNASIQYNLNDHLNIIYRAGLDVYNENNLNYQNKGGVNSNSNDARLLSGFYETWNNRKTIWDHNVLINGQYNLSEDLGLTFTIGGTTRNEIFDQNGTASDGQQVFGVLRHSNFLNQNEIQSFAERNIVGIYSQAELEYKNFMYLTLAGRNDWVSNFSKDNRSIFYPSASVSFLPTNAFEEIRSSTLNYLKIRAGYGTSANFGDLGYPVANTLFLDTQDSNDGSGANIVTNTTSFVLGNPNLKPELLKEFEVGVESRLWDNRITLDLSLYKRTTKDLIIDRPLDPSTGYTTTKTNIGEIKNNGIEVDLGVDIFKSADVDGFNWNINTNFTAYESEVTDLGLDTELVVYSGFSNLGNAAIPGEPLGVLYGATIVRDNNGNAVIGSDGFYLNGPDGIIGDPNPDWVSNVRNTISYKNFTLGFQFNYTHGGDFYSSTISTLLGRGLIPETVDRTNTYIIPGVDINGNPNTVQINNSDFYFSNIFSNTKPEELKVWDASTIRLQELSLSYSLPKDILEKTPFGSLTLTFSGNNLWYDAINTPDGAKFDPNTNGTGVGNGFGFDYLNGPSARRYGLSIKTTF